MTEKRGVLAGQQTHTDCIVAEVDCLGSRDVVLVGLGYAGIPVGEAAERCFRRCGR
ncbi:hypothetical protein ACQUSR_00450 [Streptomyces sp. P1-3]|uniref:hypothetical protein n=1 Tax=Streptomyces sp. P1-3 TaxID=3421658 RepID=UPI003D36790A